MKHIFLSCICAAFAICSPAQATEPYLSINLGGAIETSGDDSAISPTFGAAVGLKNIARDGPFSLRAEIEAQLFFQDESAPAEVGLSVDEQAFTAAGFANLWLDYQPIEDIPVTLSIGGGVGLAVTHCDLCVGSGFASQVGDTTDVNVAFNLGVAASYALGPRWEMGGSVRYFDYGAVNSSNTPGFFRDIPVIVFEGTAPRRGVQALATLRYTFGPVDF